MPYKKLKGPVKAGTYYSGSGKGGVAYRGSGKGGVTYKGSGKAQKKTKSGFKRKVKKAVKLGTRVAVKRYGRHLQGGGFKKFLKGVGHVLGSAAKEAVQILPSVLPVIAAL